MEDVIDRRKDHYLAKADEYRVPYHTACSLIRYITNGVPTGGFLHAVLSNNLMGAFSQADMENRLHLYDICNFMYNVAPMECHGAVSHVDEWITRGGLDGRD